MKNIDSVLKFLAYLNLSVEESKVYIGLIESGDQTVLELSESKQIPRTNVYRIVDNLIGLGLIEEITIDGKKRIQAVGFERLEVLVKEQESKVEYLKQILPEIQVLLPSAQTLSQPGTSIKLYRGKPGIKQIIWNILRSRETVRSYIYQPMEEFVDIEFIERWSREVERENLAFIGLASDESLTSNEEKNTIIYVPRQKLEINFQLSVYNNVVSIYHKFNNEIVGFEIIDKKIAKFQKQVFDILVAS